MNEQNTKKEYMSVTVRHLGSASGRTLSTGKVQFKKDNPDNAIIFNACLCTDKHVLWYGDIDLSVDEGAIGSIAREIDKNIYILTEVDLARNAEAISIEHAVFISDGINNHIGQNFNYLFHRIDGIIRMKNFGTEKYELTKEEKEQLASTYKEDEFESKIKMPTDMLDEFKSFDIKISPFEKFHRYVARELGGVPEGHAIKVTASWVGFPVYKLLRALSLKWIRTVIQAKEDEEEEILSELCINYAPNYFPDEILPVWFKEGYIYVKHYPFMRVDQDIPEDHL